MGVIRNTASMQIRGKVGNTTYYVEGGRQIARVSQNGSNYGESASRTEKQQFQRGKWGNLVNFYKVSKKWMTKAFESKKRTQSDYNRFMQLNTTNARIYLTKNMYANGGCVADEFRISEGSLRPVSVVKSGNIYVTDLYMSPGDIDDRTQVGGLSDDLITNNSFLREGMQISFISYQQTLSPEGTPSLICTAYEMTLDTQSTERVFDYLPPFCAQNVNGRLGTSAQISTGAFAYVLSETRNGKTSVSTQSLITKNDVLIAEYSSEEAIRRSIDSYGVDADVFLTSGSYPTGATPQPVYIEKLTWDSSDDVEVVRVAGSPWFEAGELFYNTSNRRLFVSGRYTTVGNAFVTLADSSVQQITTEVLQDSTIKLGSISSSFNETMVVSIGVDIDGVRYTIEFAQV